MFITWTHFHYRLRKKHWDTLNKTGYVGNELGQGKSEYDNGGIFYALLLVPKVIYCLTINEYGVIGENKTYEGFEDVTKILEKKFKMQNGITVKQDFPLSWRNSFSCGVIIPTGIKVFENCVKSVDKVRD